MKKNEIQDYFSGLVTNQDDGVKGSGQGRKAYERKKKSYCVVPDVFIWIHIFFQCLFLHQRYSSQVIAYDPLFEDT